MKKVLVFTLLCCLLCGAAYADSSGSICSLDCGNGTVFVIMDDGKLIAWGDNSAGLIPRNSHKYIKYDDRQLVMSNAESVYVGDACVLAINTDSELYGWGSDANSSLLCGKANGGFAKVPVKLMDNVVCAAAGTAHNAAVTADGCLYTWGKDCNGSLGISSVSGSCARNPQRVMENISSVYCYGNDTLAISNDCKLYAWGEDFGFTKPQLISSKIVNVAKACGGTFLLQNTDGEALILKCDAMEDGTPCITLTPAVASNVSEIVDYGYIRNDGTLWMCESEDSNAFVPSAENVKLAQCCDMRYRAYVTLRTLHIEKNEFKTFIKDANHSISDIDVQIHPNSFGVVTSVLIAAFIGAVIVIVIEKPDFYLRLKNEVLRLKEEIH